MNNIKHAVRRSRQQEAWFRMKKKPETSEDVCEACECDPCDCGWGNYLKVEKKKKTF